MGPEPTSADSQANALWTCSCLSLNLSDPVTHTTLSRRGTFPQSEAGLAVTSPSESVGFRGAGVLRVSEGQKHGALQEEFTGQGRTQGTNV